MKTLFKLGALAALTLLFYKIGRNVGQESVRRETRGGIFYEPPNFITISSGRIENVKAVYKNHAKLTGIKMGGEKSRSPKSIYQH